MTYDKIDIPIKIGREEYFIGSDRYNFILGKKILVKGKRKGKEVEVLEFAGNSTSYFGTLEALMVHLQNKLIKTKSASTLLQLQKNLTKTKNEICDLYKTINKDQIRNS